MLGRLGPASPATAGGGSSKASCREAILEPSWPLMSVDDAGVGSCVRGILVAIWRSGLSVGRTGARRSEVMTRKSVSGDWPEEGRVPKPWVVRST